MSSKPEASTSDRSERIRSALNNALQPDAVEIVDESHLHAGHVGARDGKGHFRVTLISNQFSGVALLKRHRMVFEALKEMMQTDIHALSIDARTPQEGNA